MTHLKFCIDCIYCRHNVSCPATSAYFCIHDANIVNYDLVTGREFYDKTKSCVDERTSHGSCGVEGKHYILNKSRLDSFNKYGEIIQSLDDLKMAPF